MHHAHNVKNKADVVITWCKTLFIKFLELFVCNFNKIKSHFVLYYKLILLSSEVWKLLISFCFNNIMCF